MAFDAGMLRAVLYDIGQNASGARVEKIYQPARDEVDLLLHCGRETRRLALHTGTAPRLSFTALARENPAVAPMFCMLLRKQLTGARLLEVRQLGFDRVARLVFSCLNEMGYAVIRNLVVELMGKYSNLILTDEGDRIIAVLKPVDFSDSEIRQLLPGLHYELPGEQDKLSPLTATREEFFAAYAAFDPSRAAERFITATYLGTAASTAREIVFRAAGRTDATVGDLPAGRLWEAFDAWFDRLRHHRYTPTLVTDGGGTPTEYAYAPLLSCGDAAQPCASFTELFDRFFGERDLRERIRQRSTDLCRLLGHAVARLEKKLALQREELADCARGEEYKRQGDLITANLYRLRRGDACLRALDYSVDPPEEVTLQLDTRLSPAQNAQRLYKLYNKAKHAPHYLVGQIEEAEAELRYVESVQAFLDRAETEADLIELRDELYRAGFASRMKNYTPQKQVKSRPMTFVTSGGYRLLCGRNNTQNELLTFRTAGRGDLWFHAKNVPGSHVILVCDGEEPSERDYTEAAALAAYYSQAKGDHIAVDYTRVRNVKKPPGAKPGYVIYHTNYTAYVSPALPPQEESEKKP